MIVDKLYESVIEIKEKNYIVNFLICSKIPYTIITGVSLMGKNNMNLIKQVNLHHLRTTMLNIKTATKPELAKHIGVSVITVNSLVKTLLKTGEMIKDHMTKPDIGRPAIAYRLNEKYSYALIIYTFEKDGEDVVSFLVSDYCGNDIIQYEKQLSYVNKNNFDEEIQKLIEEYPSIEIIGLGLPVSEANGKIISSDYPSLIGVDLCSYIYDKFKIKSFIVTDIKAATAGYCHLNKINKAKSVVGLYFPHKYPPGAAIYLNGDLYLGRDGLAGRITRLYEDIDWSKYSFSSIKIRNIIVKIVKNLTFIFNPHILVIYFDFNSELLDKHIQNSITTDIENIMKPEIIVSNNLNRDFMVGIKQLALNKLYQRNFSI